MAGWAQGYRWTFGVLGASLVLAACAQPVSTSCPTQARADAATTWQVLVHFREPVQGRDPSTVQQLERLSQACVQPVTSVSPTLHAYRFSGVASLDLLRQRLQRWPLVRDVQADGRVRATTPP